MAKSLITKHQIETLVNLKLNDESEKRLKSELTDLFANQSVDFSSEEFKKNFQDILDAFNAVFRKAELDPVDLMPNQDGWYKLGELARDKFVDAWKNVAGKGGMNFSFDALQLDKVVASLGEIEKKLDAVSTKSGGGNAKKILKNLNEVDAAIQRKAVTPKALNSVLAKSSMRIPSTASASDEDAAKWIGGFLEDYKASVTNKDPWEVQYKNMLQFSRAYEAYAKKLSSEELVNFEGMFQGLSGAYKQVLERVPDAKASLQDIVYRINGEESVDDRNKPWARESTLQEVRNILKGGLKVSADGGSGGRPKDEPPKSDVPKVETQQPKATNIKPNAFRGVIPPDESGGNKITARESIGGSYFVPVEYKHIAEQYGTDIGGDILKAVIQPLNELAINAYQKNFSDIDQVRTLQYLFPGYDTFQQSSDAQPGDKAQKYFNEMARQAGFDSFVVQEVNEGSGKMAELVDTIAVLQDRTVSYLGELPEYYQHEQMNPEDERVLISRQKGTSERWYAETIARLKQERDAVAGSKEDYQSAIKFNELNELIPQLESMRDSAMAAFDKAIEPLGGYIQEEVERGLPQVITNTEDGMRALVSQDTLRSYLSDYQSELGKKNTKRRDELWGVLDELTNGDEDLQDAIDKFTDGSIDLDQAFKLLAPAMAFDYEDVKQIRTPQNDAIKPAANKNDQKGSGGQADTDPANKPKQVDAIDTTTLTAAIQGAIGDIAKEQTLGEIKGLVESLVPKVDDDASPEQSGDEPNEQNKDTVAIDEASLKTVLEGVTYNVKVVDDADSDADQTSLTTAIESATNDLAKDQTINNAKDAIISAISGGAATAEPKVDKATQQQIKQETGNQEQRFERLNDIASNYEDIDDMEAAIQQFGAMYKQIVLMSDDGYKYIKPNKTGINTLGKIASGDFDISDYSGVEFQRVDKPSTVTTSIALDSTEITNAIKESAVDTSDLAKEETLKATRDYLQTIADNTKVDITSGADVDETKEDQLILAVNGLIDKLSADNENQTAINGTVNVVSPAEANQIAQEGTLQQILSAMQNQEPANDNTPETPDVEPDDNRDIHSSDNVDNKNEINEAVEKSKKVISIQKDWLKYLDAVLDDGNFKTSGKKEASDQLRKRTHDLVDYRMHPEQYPDNGLGEEKRIVAWNKAYEEAQRQGVAQSTLDKNYTDAAGEYANALNKLQAERESHVNILNREEEALRSLTQVENVETEARRQSTDVIARENALENADNAQADISEIRAETAATEARTDAQRELNTAIASEPGATPMTDDIPTTATSTALVPANVNESAETRDMTTLLSAVQAVTEAVKLKTRAFWTEKTAVDQVVDGEVAALDELETKLTNIKLTLEGLLNNIRSGESDLAAGLSNINVTVNNPENSKVDLDDGAIERLISAVNGIKSNQDGAASSTSAVGNVLATENTLLAIKTAVESINGKTVQGIKLGGGSKGGGRKSAGISSYKGSSFFAEKLKTREMELAKFAQQLMNAGRDTDEMKAAVKRLQDSLKQVNSGEKLSVWDQLFRQTKLSDSIGKLQDEPETKEKIEDYKQLIDFAKKYYKLVEKYEKAEAGSERKKTIEQQKSDVEAFLTQSGIDFDSLTFDDETYNKKLSDLRAGHKNRIGEISAANTDKQNAKALKQKEDEIKLVKKIQAEAAKLEADLKFSSGEVETQELQRQIAQKQQYIDLKQQELGIDKQELAQIHQKAYANEQNNRSLAEARKQSRKVAKDALQEEKDGVAELRKLYAQLGAEVAERKYSGTQESKDAHTQTINELLKKIEGHAYYKSEYSGEMISAMRDSRSSRETSLRQRAANKAGTEKTADIAKLAGLYEKLGKQRAVFDKTGNLEAQQEAEHLRGIIASEQKRLDVTHEQIEAMKQREDAAFKEQGDSLDAKQREADRKRYQQEEERAAQQAKRDAARDNKRMGQQMARSIDRAQKENFKKQVSQSRSSARIGKAKSAMDSADDLIYHASATEGIDASEHTVVQKLNSELTRLRELYQQIQNNAGVIPPEDQEALINQTRNVQSYSAELKRILQQYDALSGDNVVDTKIAFDVGNGSLEEQLTKAAKAATDGRAKVTSFDAATGQLTVTVKDSNNAFTEYTYAVREYDHQIVQVQGTTKRAEGFFESLGRKMKEVMTYFSGSSIIYRFFGEIRRGIQYIREIDMAMTELKKVTNETDESYKRFMNSAAQTADKVGSTIQEVISSTADWSRLGYTMEQAAKLAESTSVLLNVSEFQSIDEATSALVSTMQAFGYTAQQSMGVVDVMNQIGNNFAISSDGLATALQDSASALMTANNSYEEAVSLVAAANRVVQNPSEVGGALRTISLRLRGTSVEELEEAGEDTTGAVGTKSKLRSKLKGLTGVDILTDTGAYKSTYEILLEISKVWNSLTDENRAGALELIAGKNRANVASALLTNTKDLEEAYASAMTAEGSAYAENEKYLDSIQGRIDQFTNALQTMWNNVLDDEAIKWFVELGTKLIKLADDVGVVRIAFMALGTFFSRKLFVKDGIDVVGAFKGMFGGSASKNIKAVTDKLKELKKAANDANDAYYAKASEENKTKRDNAQKAYADYIKQNPSVKKFAELTDERDGLLKRRAELQKEYQELRRYAYGDLTNEQKDGFKLPITIDTSEVDTQIASVKDKLEAEKSLLVPGADNAAEVEANIASLNGQLDELQQQRRDLIDSDVQSAMTQNVLGTQKINNQVQQLDKDIKKAGKSIKKTGTAGGVALKKLGKAAWETAESMLMMQAIMAAFDIGVKLFNDIANLFKKDEQTAEEAQEEFENLNSELEGCKSEVRNLESELDSTKDRIEELMSSGTLSFVEQEELNNLRQVSEELEKQLKLQNTLQDSLQKATNVASANATNKYLTETSFASEMSKADQKEKSSSTGKAAGKALGLVAGAAASFIPGAAAIAPALVGGLSMLGEWIGGLVGGGLGERKYENEETVGDAIKNMRKTRQELEKAKQEAFAAYAENPQDEEIAATYAEAESALAKYDETMAKHISQIQSNYNAMDWDLAGDAEKEAMRKQADLLDTYAIEMGDDGAKASAIERMFGDEANDVLKEVKKQMTKMAKAKKSFDISALFGENTAELNKFRERLHDLGISLYEVEQYFIAASRSSSAFADTLNINDVYTVAEDINELTDGLDKLKSAFEEVQDSGTVSASTLTGLSEVFKDSGTAWDNYCSTVFSGASTLHDVKEATEKLTQAFLAQKLTLGKLTAQEKLTYTVQLQNLGVENAEELVNNEIEKSMYAEMEKAAKLTKDGRQKTINAFFKEGRRYAHDDDLYKQWYGFSTEEVAGLADKYNIAKEVTIEDAQRIASEYGVNIDNAALEEQVKLLNEKLAAEKELASLQAQQQEQQQKYYDWSVKKEKAENAAIVAQSRLKQLEQQYGMKAGDWQYVDPGDGGDPYYRDTVNQRSYSADDNSEYIRGVKELVAANDELASAHAQLSELKTTEPKLISQSAVDDAQQKVDQVTSAYNSLIRLDDADIEIKLDIKLGKVGTVFDEYNSKMEILAEIQHEVADGFVISAERAREFAETYPEILSMATTTADGQMQLNENVVNAMLEGKRAELNAEIDKQIETLQAKIAGAEAEKQLAQAQLDLARDVINGELEMSADQLVAEISNSNALKAALEQAGMDNASASKLAYAAMSTNAGEYESIVKEVAETNALNFDQSACDTANSLLVNFTDMQGVVTNFMHQCQEAAKAVAGISSGVVDGTEIGIGGNGGQKTVDLSGYKVTAAEFTGVDAEIPIEFKEIDIHQFLGGLQKEIDGYDLEIDALNGQIELLEAQKNRKWEEFHSDYDEETGTIRDGDEDDGDSSSSIVEKVTKKYERKLSMLDAQKQYLENEISRLEAKNEPVSKSLYEEQIKIEEKKLKLYEQERKELLAAMNTVPKHSDDWNDLAKEVWGVEHAIQESTLAIIEMNDAITQLYIDAFDKLGGAHGDKITFLDGQKQYIEDYISYLETLGVEVPDDMYEKLISVETEALNQNYAKLADLENQFADAQNNGLKKTDEEWVRMSEDIRQVESDILASKTAIAEFNKEMRDAEWESFNELMERIEDVESEMDHMVGLFEDDKVANEDGTWTKEGIAQLGLFYQQMKSAESVIEEYGKKIEQLNKEYDAGKWSESEYYEKLQELKDGQWDAVEATEAQKDAIIDLHEARVDEIENGIKKEIEAYEELVKVKKEELDAERDLYDFRKNIKDQTKDIATLERRIAAMSGSTDAATIAERTRLEAELREKRESLNDTYYDHSMDSQSSALDDEQTSFEDSKNKYLEQLREILESPDFLIDATMYDVLVNADTILNQLNTTSQEKGITLSANLLAPWEAAATQATTFKETAETLLTGMTNPDGIISMFNATANGLIQAVFRINEDTSTGFTTTVSTLLGAMYEEGGSIANFALYASQKTEAPFVSGQGKAGWFSGEVATILGAMYADNGSIGLFNSNVIAKFQNTFGAGKTAADGFKSHVANQIDLIAADINSENIRLTSGLKKPWDDGRNAANTFSTRTGTILDGLVTKAQRTAADISKEATKIINDMNAAQAAIDKTGGGSGNGSGSGSGGGGTTNTNTKPATAKATPKYVCGSLTTNIGGNKVTHRRQYEYGGNTGRTIDEAQKMVETYLLNASYKRYTTEGRVDPLQVDKYYEGWKKNIKWEYYAKGTTGTTKDQWAITDEPQYGDELVLVPGKNGNLSYMRKGTAVIPADISENLMKLGMNPDFSNMSNGIKGINIMTNYVNKPEVKLDIENFLHVDNVSQDTMPELKKFVKEQVNSMVRQLNYGLKR